MGWGFFEKGGKSLEHIGWKIGVQAIVLTFKQRTILHPENVKNMSVEGAEGSGSFVVEGECRVAYYAKCTSKRIIWGQWPSKPCIFQ